MSLGLRFTPLDETRVTVGTLSGAHLVNHMYLVMLPPLFGPMGDAFDVPLTQLGIALGVIGLVGAIVQLPYGYLADNHHRLIGFGINKLFGALGAGVIALSPSFPWVIAGAAIMGLGIAGHETVHYPIISQTTTDDYRGRAFSVYEFSGQVGFMITPALIAGIMAAGSSWRIAVGVIGFLGMAYTLFAIGFLLINGDANAYKPIGDEGADRLGVFERARTGVRKLVRSPPIIAMAVFTFLITAVNWGIVSYVVVMLVNGYGISPNVANVILTGMFVFTGAWVLYGGVIIDKVARGPDTVMAGSFGLTAPLVAILGTVAFPAVVAATLVLLIGAAQGPSQPAIGSITDTLSSEEDFGLNMAVITIGTYAGNGIAPPLIGSVVDNAGLQAAFLSISVIGLGAAILMVVISRRYVGRESTRSLAGAD